MADTHPSPRQLTAPFIPLVISRRISLGLTRWRIFVPCRRRRTTSTSTTTLAVRRSAVAELSLHQFLRSKSRSLAHSFGVYAVRRSLSLRRFLKQFFSCEFASNTLGLWRSGLSAEQPSLELMAGSECFLQIGRCFFFRLLGFWYDRGHAKELMGDSSEVLIGDFHPFAF